jgi:hypothetical protein
MASGQTEIKRQKQALGRRQAVRHRFLVPAFPGSNPGAPAMCRNSFYFKDLRDFKARYRSGFPPYGTGSLSSAGAFVFRSCSWLRAGGRSSSAGSIVALLEAICGLLSDAKFISNACFSVFCASTPSGFANSALWR